MSVPAVSVDGRSRIKKSIELDRDVDQGLKEIAGFQFVPQISLINQVLRDYVELTLPDVRRRKASGLAGNSEP